MEVFIFPYARRGLREYCPLQGSAVGKVIEDLLKHLGTLDTRIGEYTEIV